MAAGFHTVLLQDAHQGRVKGSAPLTAASPCAHRAAVSTNPSPCRKTQCTQGLQGSHKEFLHPTHSLHTARLQVPASSIQHNPRPKSSPWPGQGLIRRVPCRVIGWVAMS